MKILIIGYGSIGKRYFKILKKYQFDVKIFDTQKLVSLKDKIFFKNSNNAYNWKADIIIICNNSDQHILTLFKFYHDNIKAVLIEKPIDVSFKKIQKLNLSNLDKKKIFVVNNIIYFEPIDLIKKQLKYIGKIYFANIFFGHHLLSMREKKNKESYFLFKKKSGGVALDCIHEVLYSIYLFGNVKKISIRKSKLSDLKVDYEDLVDIDIIHQNNILSKLSLDFIQTIKNRGCEIFGNKGTIIWRSFGKKNVKNSIYLIRKNKSGKEFYKNIFTKYDINDQYEKMIKELVDFSKNRINKNNKLLNFNKFYKYNLKLKDIYNK